MLLLLVNKINLKKIFDILYKLWFDSVPLKRSEIQNESSDFSKKKTIQKNYFNRFSVILDGLMVFLNWLECEHP